MARSCDGSCFADPHRSEQFPCEDGEVLSLVYCRHEDCFILKTYTPADEAAQIYESLKGLLSEFKRRRKKKGAA